MENVFKMSLFMPPISPIKDKTTGRTVKSATLTPLRTINLEEIYKLITSNEKLTALTLEVRNAALWGDENTSRLLKQQTLPYVTPCGVFTRRRSDCLEEASGLVVVDMTISNPPKKPKSCDRNYLMTRICVPHWHSSVPADWA